MESPCARVKTMHASSEVNVTQEHFSSGVGLLALHGVNSHSGPE